MRPVLALSLLLLAALAPSVAARQDQSQTRDTARFALSSEPLSFDPLAADLTGNQVVQRQVYEGLVEYGPGPHHALQGLLAESWTRSADGLTWTFTLRDDVRFHDFYTPALWPGGERAVTAQDVVDSWLRMANLSEGARNYWAAEGLIDGLDEYYARSKDPQADKKVAGLKVLPDGRLQVRLTRSDPWFLARLASAYFVVYPAEAVERSADEFLNQPVGSGPYRLDDWTPGARAGFARIPSWRGQNLTAGQTAATIPKLQFSFVGDSSTRTLLFEKGEIDRLPPTQDSFARMVPGGQLAEELAAQGVQLFQVEVPDLSMLCFNMYDPVVGDIPGDALGNLKRKRFRQAISLAFPYERWHKIMRNEIWGTPALRVLPPSIPGFESIAEAPYRQSDIARARELLAEAGWPNGVGAPTLQFETGGTDATNLALGEIVQHALGQIGVQVEIVANSWPELTSKMAEGRAQLFTRAWSLDWADPLNLLEVFYGPNRAPGINRCNYDSPRFNGLFEQIRRSPVELQLPLVREAVAVLVEDVPMVPIDHRRGFLLVQPWLLGADVNAFDPMPCKFYRFAD